MMTLFNNQTDLRYGANLLNSQKTKKQNLHWIKCAVLSNDSVVETEATNLIKQLEKVKKTQ